MASIAGSLKLTTKSADITKVIGFAIPAIAIIFSAAVSYFVVWPKINEVLTMRNTNMQNVELVQKLDEKVTQLTSLDAVKLTDQITSATHLLPSDKDVFTLLSQIENTAGSSGVIISNLNIVPGAVGKAGNSVNTAPGAAPPPPVKDTADPPDVSKISVKISLTSDYRGLLAFFGGISTVPRVIAVKDLTIGSSGTSGQVTSSFTLDSYWQAMPTDLPNIETPIVKLTPEQEEVLENVNTGTAAIVSNVPQVPLGRTDLFAPF